jgi:hypothetical protein
MTEAGLSDLALAQRPGMDGEAVHRRRDLLRQSRIAELDAALRVLAKRMVIVMEAAEGRDAGSCSHVCTGIAPPATIDAVFQRHQSLPEQQRNPIVPCDFQHGRNIFIAQQQVCVIVMRRSFRVISINNSSRHILAWFF